MRKICINFDTSSESIKQSIEIVRDFLPFLREHKMFYYYPFTPDSDQRVIETQVMKDLHEFDYSRAVQTFTDYWSIYETRVLERLEKISDAKVQNYTCVLTMYGPQGYYYTPNKVFVNITKNDAADWIHTFVHELLHLIFFETTKEMLHEEVEKLIDKTLVDVFGDMFENYRVQNFS